MDADHPGDSGGEDAASPVTAVPDAWERDGEANALLAEGSFTQQQGAGADEAEVMQRLDGRHAFRAGGVEDRGRDEREEVMDGDDLGPGLAKGSADVMVVLAAPDGAEADRPGTCASDAFVVADVLGDGVAMGSEEIAFGLEDLVFASTESVAAVHHEDAHGAQPFPFRWAAGCAARQASRTWARKPMRRSRRTSI